MTYAIVYDIQNHDSIGASITSLHSRKLRNIFVNQFITCWFVSCIIGSWCGDLIVQGNVLPHLSTNAVMQRGAIWQLSKNCIKTGKLLARTSVHTLRSSDTRSPWSSKHSPVLAGNPWGLILELVWELTSARTSSPAHDDQWDDACFPMLCSAIEAWLLRSTAQARVRAARTQPGL